MRILVTGGAGYIGSHTCVALLEGGYDVTVVDNLSNSSMESLRRVQSITGRTLDFFETDIQDTSALAQVFKSNPIDGVIHFAGLKAVGESVEFPMKYYQNNIAGTLNLLQVMEQFDVKRIVFSSSATVYGNPVSLPIREDFSLSVTNPYGRTKLMIEDILRDVHTADHSWDVILLRYFNPVGAHASGQIGEDPNGIPNNLMPFISQVAVGALPEVNVFGDDYDTPDGTGVRDYIHVVDLARGHLKALARIFERPGVAVYNLGTGQGYSVLEMIGSFARVTGQPVPYKVVERRQGDIAACWADPAKAFRELGWKAEKNLDDMCTDTWKWQKLNPQGFQDS
ncbi:MAG: UDP-glucose 4-epimerase GalE [Desulfobacteraceae bacterium]|nr:MAG: UDP-glucose 4-epimerase GalE [Desulfobacteraceae bacterium]